MKQHDFLHLIWYVTYALSKVYFPYFEFTTSSKITGIISE